MIASFSHAVLECLLQSTGGPSQVCSSLLPESPRLNVLAGASAVAPIRKGNCSDLTATIVNKAYQKLWNSSHVRGKLSPWHVIWNN